MGGFRADSAAATHYERATERNTGKTNRKNRMSENAHFYSSLAVIDFMIYLFLFHYM